MKSEAETINTKLEGLSEEETKYIFDESIIQRKDEESWIDLIQQEEKKIE